jgi:type I restriction enzyme S subunit
VTKPWPNVRLGELLARTERSEAVDASKVYQLLGVRLDGQGPFLRETLMGTQTSAGKLFRVATGDFIYSRLFACRGAFGVITEELDGSYVSGEFPTFVPVQGTVDVAFLKYWFRLPSVITTVDADCTGSTPLTRNRFKENFFLALKIPLPPLEEQRRVVARIEELAAQIHEARTLRHQAAEEAQALLQNQVGRVFTQIEERHKPREFGSFSPHVTSGPRNWAKHYEQNGSRFYRAQDIGPAGNVLHDSKVFITPPPGEQGRTAMLQHGDLMLVITGATVGRASVYRKGLEPGFVSQHVGICRLPQSEVEPEFALWGLRGPAGQAQLLGQRYGQGKPGLNLTNIRSLALPFPSLAEQRRIMAELDALQAEVGALKRLQTETAAELDALLPAILDKAFRGEL